MGAALGGAFAALWNAAGLSIQLSVPAYAMVGMGANRNFTVVREDETAFDVIRRMWRRNAIMAVVVRGLGVPRGSDVAGVITKEHVADSVADSVKAYPQ
jgi:chloride channel protein, CIC family